MSASQVSHTHTHTHTHTLSLSLSLVCLLPGKTLLRLTGGLLVSTVTLYLAFLEVDVGQQTSRRGRKNLHWATLGTPEEER